MTARPGVLLVAMVSSFSRESLLHPLHLGLLRCEGTYGLTPLFCLWILDVVSFIGSHTYYTHACKSSAYAFVVGAKLRHLFCYPYCGPVRSRTVGICTTVVGAYSSLMLQKNLPGLASCCPVASAETPHISQWSLSLSLSLSLVLHRLKALRAV